MTAPNSLASEAGGAPRLEEALSKLDLQATLVLLTVLSQRALMLQQKEAKATKIDKLLKPDTAIKLPTSLHKPIEL